MKPIFWIPILTLAGGELGFGLTQMEGWFGAAIGCVVGATVGIILYFLFTKKDNSSKKL